MDSILNFLYIVAFLAAMVLPAFQRQRKEAARKRAEAQRLAEEIPTVEERPPEDVPAPVIRRAPVPSTAAAPAAAAATAATAESEAEPEAAQHPEVATAAAREVGRAGLTHLDEEIDLTALDEEIDLTVLDDAEAASSGTAAAKDRPGLGDGGLRSVLLDRASLRQAFVWRELFDTPLGLRSRRGFHE